MCTSVAHIYVYFQPSILHVDGRAGMMYHLHVKLIIGVICT